MRIQCSALQRAAQPHGRCCPQTLVICRAPASDGQRRAQPGGRGRAQRRRGQRRRGRCGRRRGRGQPGRRPRGRGQPGHRPASRRAAPSAFLQLLRGLDERRPGVPPATLRGRAAQRPRGQKKRRKLMLGHLLRELLRQLCLWGLLLLLWRWLLLLPGRMLLLPVLPVILIIHSFK